MTSDPEGNRTSAALQQALNDLHARVDRETRDDLVPVDEVLSMAGLDHLVPLLAGGNESRIEGSAVQQGLAGIDDQQLLMQLREQSCRGPLWQSVLEVLATHSWTTLNRMLRAAPFEVRSVSMSRLEYKSLIEEQGLLDDLFYDALVREIEVFASRIMNDLDMDEEYRGSLWDYFLQGLLSEFRTSVQSWRRRRYEDCRVDFVARERLDELVSRESLISGAEDTYLSSLQLIEILDALEVVDLPLREAIILRAETGASWSSIAQQIGLTPHALERRRRRFTAVFSRGDRVTDAGD